MKRKEASVWVPRDHNRRLSGWVENTGSLENWSPASTFPFFFFNYFFKILIYLFLVIFVFAFIFILSFPWSKSLSFWPLLVPLPFQFPSFFESQWITLTFLPLSLFFLHLSTLSSLIITINNTYNYHNSQFNKTLFFSRFSSTLLFYHYFYYCCYQVSQILFTLTITFSTPHPHLLSPITLPLPLLFQFSFPTSILGFFHASF